MLAHLDKNHLTLKGTVRQDDLYDLMLNIANHSLTNERIAPRTKRRLGPLRFPSDHQVDTLTDWIDLRVTKVTRGERHINYRQLRKILKPHGYVLGNIGSNTIEVLREDVVRKGIILRREEVVQYKPVTRIGYRNEGEEVSLKTIKQLRTRCGLREEDGVDTEAFYAGADVIDTFVNKYRIVLRRLAKT